MNLESFISALAETIIPGEKDSGILSGSQVNFISFLEKNNKLELVKTFKSNIEISFRKDFESNLWEESEDTLKKYLIKSKRKNFRLLNEISVLLCECYYSDIRALKKLKLPVDPPFPNGNIIKEIDLSILEDVYNRGKIYR
jgi:hypothetical protein